MTHDNSAALTDLAGFPMAFAVSADAINQKFAELYGNASNSPQTFPMLPWDLSGSGWKLHVTDVSAPRVTFATEYKQGVAMDMEINAGDFFSFENIMPPDMHFPPTAEDLKKIKVKSVQTPLNGVTLSVIAKVDMIEHEDWSDANFSAQALFMDLEKIMAVDLRLSQDSKVSVSGTLKSGIETLLNNHLDDIAKKAKKARKQPLLFGAVKLPRIEKETTGPLKPTKSAYSVTVDHADDGTSRSALNFLLCNSAVPDIRRTNGAGIFDHCLLHGDGLATLVISDATVLDSFVRPAIMDAWKDIDLRLERRPMGKDPSVLGFTGDFNFGVTLDDHDRNAYLKQFVAQIKNNRIHIDYHWTSSVYHWSSDIDVEVSGTQTIKLKTENGALSQTIDTPEPHVATDDSDLTARVFGDILTFGFDEIGRQKTSDSGKRSMQHLNKNIMDNIGSALESFVLPGGAVLKFEGAWLDRHLYVNASYR